MRKKPKPPWHPSNPEGLAKQFSRLGWIGVWTQIALLCIPILLLIYVLLLRGPESAEQRGIDLSNYLSNSSLLIMLFTTLWFYRYTRLAERIVDPELRPPLSSVLRTLWIGLWAGCLGILFSMVLMFNAVGRLLHVLIATPQTGLPVAPVMGGDPGGALSAIDAVSLMTLLIMLSAELVVLGLSLWLLFRVTRSSADSPKQTTDVPETPTQAQ